MFHTAIAVDEIGRQVILDTRPVTERDYVLERISCSRRYERRAPYAVDLECITRFEHVLEQVTVIQCY